MLTTPERAGDIFFCECSVNGNPMHGYEVASPHGTVKFRAHEKSKLVHRLMYLCEIGALPEFAKRYQHGLTGQCHLAAFEFAYAVTVSFSRTGGVVNHTTLGMWRWCVARRAVNGHDLHSWIERDTEGEAFDVALDDQGNDFVYVRPCRQLWKQFQVEGVESRSFAEFARWLSAGDNAPLFVRYPEIDLSNLKASITVVRV